MEPGEFEGVVGRGLEESTPWWPPLPGRAGPNVVMVLLDDVGYAQFGCYGSDIATPTFDRLAATGVRYSNFHTTALCSPTRACLLTGRNHHASGMGRIVEFSSGFPGYDATMPQANGFLSEVLVRHGYATFAVGKWHLAPAAEMATGASKARWPLGRGFEGFYGFLAGETDQYHPDLVHDNHQVDPPRTPEEGYHLTEDLADRAIDYVRDLRAVSADRPFFLYFAPGACHAPHQVPAAYPERYRGQFDHGWDRWRDEVFARQQASGLLPPGTAAQRAAALGAGVGLARRRRAPALRPHDGGLRRLPHPHRRAGRSGARRHRRAGRARRHDRARHERQRGQRRGRPARVVQRELLLQPRARVARGEPAPDRRARRAERPQPLPVGLGVGRRDAAQAVEAGDPRGRRHRPADRVVAGRAASGATTAARSATSTSTPST